MDKFIQGAIILEKYQIIKLLGKGGFSKVYLASNLKLGNKIAIKVIDKSLYKSQLLAEKNILTKLRHSSIVVIFDIEEDDDYYYLIEEYIEGKTLEHLEKELSENEIKAILYQLLDVFNFLHTKFNEPIIYRDLKPSNIMIMENGAIKLIDFGIASPMEMSASLKDHNYGTKSYCAPEQVCYGTTDKRTDIYSLGVTIYYLLTGKNLSHPPYKILTVRHFRKDISQGFSEIINKMTQTLPAKRYQNISEIIRDLDDINMDIGTLSDVDFFAKMAKKVIYITGIKRGIGTTYLTQLLGHFFASHGKKVALVEWMNRGDFIKVAGLDDVMEMKRYYEHDNLRGYFYISSSFENSIDKEEDILVIDAGTYEEFTFKTAGRSDLNVFVLASPSDWDMNILEDMLFSSKENTSYFVNLKGTSFVEELRSIFTDERIYAIPYNESPYKPNELTNEILSKIFASQLNADQKNTKEKKAFKGGLNEFIKNTTLKNKIFAKG